MNHVLVRDIETRSLVDLGEVGTHCYAAHPSTQVLCVGYCVDDEPVKLWHPGEPVPKPFIAAAKSDGWKAVAHQVAFEMAIEREVLGPRHGFPIIPIERQVCTLTAALAMALPGKLELCATALGMEMHKDKEGRRAMLQTTKPRRARKSENSNVVHWYNDEERLGLVDRYCMRDVEMERQLYQQLYLLSPEETKLWLLDQKINNRGFCIDYKLAQAANKIVGEAYQHLTAELIELTNGQVQSVNQVMQMRKWLFDYAGLDIPDLDKNRVELLLETVKDPRARQLLEIRQLGAHAAVKKIDAFLMRRGADGRVRGEFQFHAAGTGRWSSRGVQVHNLKRLPDDFDADAVIKVINKGDFQLAKKTYPSPLKVIGTLMRPLIVAPPGYELWGADFSGIEARVTAWLAGDIKELDVFRAYDAGLGPDPYIVTAAAIFKKSPADVTKEERQIGKACVLAFGFQGGLNAFRKFSAGDFTDEEVLAFRDAWRRAHPRIVALWHYLNDAFWDAAHNSDQLQIIRPSGIEVILDKTSFCLPVIWMRLPSGRQLDYPDIQIHSAEYRERDQGISGRGVYFMDNTQGKWWGVRVYGGLICENAVQAVARDLLAEAMLRLDKAGFKIVTHTHDEVCIEEPKGSKRFAQFTKIMNAVPDWATGLPIVAKGWQSDRYTK